MLVVTHEGTLTASMPDGTLHQVPYEALSEKDMVLQARYHLWMRQHEYRRAWVCRRCKEPLETETKANDEEQTWELLTTCACRAMYGKVPLSMVASLTQT